MGGGVIFASCGKDEDKTETPAQIEKHNVAIKINGAAGTGNDTTGYRYQAREEVLEAYQADPNIDTIFIEPYGNWSWIDGGNLTTIINTMKGIRNMVPKTWGRGDFNFYPGDVSEADSLWFVQNGWTINQQQH